MVEIAFDAIPKLTDGSGYGTGYGGSGYGDGGSGYGYGGSGSGYGGSGSDYGSGYGSSVYGGSGYGDGGSGYGYGYGYGYGDGYGYGYGYGYGVVDGDGSGSGSGSGYGYGYSGSVYGSGYGGFVYGSVFSDGSGYGYEDENSSIYYAAIAGGTRADGAILSIWRSTASGNPANGGSLTSPVKVGDIHETSGPLNLCSAGTLHATFRPDKWKGERWWIVAMHGEIAIADDKLGALKREIVSELI